MIDRPGRPDPSQLAELVRAATTASGGDRSRLAALRAKCWPGGGDRREPAASDWLRRWGPSRLSSPVAQCACATRRCAWCN